MPASAIDVSFCGAATTASTSPARASSIAVPAKASAARPLAALLVPKSSAAMSGCVEPSTLMASPDQSASPARATTRSSAAMAQATACRFSTPASPTTIALQALRTAGSSAALRLISGPMPPGRPRRWQFASCRACVDTRLLYRWHRANAREGRLLPRHERRVDHIRDALTAHRPDGKIHVFEPESVGRDLLQRKALRGKLRESELARLEAMTARALDGDELHRDFFEREIGELLHLTLNHDGAALALERFHAEQDRDGSGASGAVERHVHALAGGDLHDARERILLLDVDREVGAELFRDRHAGAVFGRSGDDDERGARLLADHRLRQPLLAGALNEHGRVIADAAVEQRPFDPVRHRRHQSRQFRRDALGDVVHDGVPGKVDVVRKAAPEMGRLLGRGVAIADGVGVAAPVGIFAVPVLAEVAPLALAAGDVVLHEHQIALLETLAPGELAPRLGDDADVLVAHDHRALGRR